MSKLVGLDALIATIGAAVVLAESFAHAQVVGAVQYPPPRSERMRSRRPRPDGAEECVAAAHRTGHWVQPAACRLSLQLPHVARYPSGRGFTRLIARCKAQQTKVSRRFSWLLPG